MKSTDPVLIDFLLSAQSYVHADLYTITLNGGAVLRWCSANMQIGYLGKTWGLGPVCSDSGVQSKAGVEVSSTDITFAASPSFTIGGTPFLDWAENGGFDGATIRIDRVFAADWPSMLAAPIGGYLRFYGRYDGAKELGQTQIVVTASDWRVLLSTNVPQDCYQTSCLNTLGDGKCQVNVAALAQTGAITAVTSDNTFASAVTAPGTGSLVLGSVLFTSGPNAGVSRTVKSFSAGTFVLTAPLPATPEVGDAFTAYPGCDLSMSMCQQYHGASYDLFYRGQPFVPSPQTGLAT